MTDFVKYICKKKDIHAPYPVSDNMEITRRVNDRYDNVFVLNYDKDSEGCVELGEDKFVDMITGKEVSGKTAVPPYDVMVLRRDRQDV